MLRALTPLFVLLVGSAIAVGCGGASGTDFDSGDASAGEPAGGGGGTGGASQGGSGGSTSGSGGSSQGGQGGSTSTGGSPTGGSPTGGSPTGGSPTGGSPTGGASGTGTGGLGGTGPTGGTGGDAGQGGTAGRAGSGGQGGTDCNLTIQRAQAALSSAQICNPLAGALVCTGSVEDLCGCTVPVNDQSSEATKYYLELREPAVKCGVPCLAIPCMEPTTPMCGIGGAISGIVAATSCHWGPR